MNNALTEEIRRLSERILHYRSEAGAIVEKVSCGFKDVRTTIDDIYDKTSKLIPNSLYLKKCFYSGDRKYFSNSCEGFANGIELGRKESAKTRPMALMYPILTDENLVIEYPGISIAMWITPIAEESHKRAYADIKSDFAILRINYPFSFTGVGFGPEFKINSDKTDLTVANKIIRLSGYRPEQIKTALESDQEEEVVSLDRTVEALVADLDIMKKKVATLGVKIVEPSTEIVLSFGDFIKNGEGLWNMATQKFLGGI